MNWLVPAPLDEFRAPMTSLFDSVMAEFFKPVDPFKSFSSDVKTRSYPKVDVRQDKADLVFEAAVPFVKKEDLDIAIKNGTLLLAGTVQKDETIEEGSFVKRELVRSSFARSFPLNDKMFAAWNSRGGKVTADLKDGILTVKLLSFCDEPRGDPDTSEIRKIEIE